MNLASLRVFFCFLLGTEMFVPKRHFQLLLEPSLPLMGLNLSCQHKMSTPLYIHSAGTKGYSRVGKHEIAQQLSQASTRQFTGSRTHQLIVSSTCKLVNSITHHLKNARTHQRTNAQPPQKQNAQLPQKQTQKLINSSVHQRTNSPTPK